MHQPAFQLVLHQLTLISFTLISAHSHISALLYTSPCLQSLILSILHDITTGMSMATGIPGAVYQKTVHVHHGS